MYANKNVGAVIPAFNEECFIGDVLDTLPEFIDRAYVIDDGSTDGTWQEITDRVSTDKSDDRDSFEGSTDPSDSEKRDRPQIIPLRHSTNRGIGSAIKTGYRYALRDEMEVTTVIAGDGQTAPDVVERIVKPVASGRVDYAKGNRMLTREGMPVIRQIGNYMLAFLTKIASGYWKVNDPQNGSTAISIRALETIDIDSLYDDFGFANDILVRLNVHGMRVADVPRRAVYRDETSHIQFKSFVINVSGLLLRNFLWRLRVKYLHRDFHPLALFYLLGAATAGIGLASVLRDLVDRRSDSGGNGSSLFVLGWLFMMLASVFDLQENEELQEIGEVSCSKIHD